MQAKFLEQLKVATLNFASAALFFTKGVAVV
jgi:hypothetical protein